MTLHQQYRVLRAQVKATPTAQRPRQRRETLAMIHALSQATAAGDDVNLHQQVQQLLSEAQRQMSGQG